MRDSMLEFNTPEAIGDQSRPVVHSVRWFFSPVVHSVRWFFSPVVHSDRQSGQTEYGLHGIRKFIWYKT